MIMMNSVTQSHLFPEKIISRHSDFLQIHQYYYLPSALGEILNVAWVSVLPKLYRNLKNKVKLFLTDEHDRTYV